jgi:tetratricopeptide (TPR) repeat protein
MGWIFVAAVFLALQAPDPTAEGMKALEEQRWEAAAAAFQKAAEADPKDYAAHFHRALALGMLKRDGEAIAGYERVLELKPGLFQAEVNLGLLLLRQNRPREAAPHLEAAVEANPKSAAAHFGLGRARALQGQLDEAAPELRRAAEMDVSYRDGLLELASLYEKAKRPQEAVAIYRQFPDLPAARERMGELLLEAGLVAEAIPELEQAVEKSPTTANRFALAAAYLRSNMPAKAAPLLEQAVAAEPGNFDLRLTYGRALRDLRQFGNAAREFLAAARLQPDSVEAWSELAGVLILTENYPQALAALDRVRALGGEKAAHLYFRAIVLDRTKQYKPALEAYQQFLAASQNRNPDEEFKARQRVRIIERELRRK